MIRFPGVNCEFESARFLRDLGVEAEIVGWNEPAPVWRRFGGFLLPGGFSYQDRVRSGVIASREPVIDSLAGAAGEGAPILGICNGAQILVEAGLVPGTDGGGVEVALAPNRMPGRTGYHCDWVHLVHGGGQSFLARRLGEGETIPLPVAHGEGRFISNETGLFDDLLERGQIPLRYATPGGEPTESFPHCPNGSTAAAAALSNREGNVVAMMPHPERAAWLHQVPDHIAGQWGAEKSRLIESEASDLFLPGPGRKILEAFCLAAREVVQ